MGKMLYMTLYIMEKFVKRSEALKVIDEVYSNWYKDFYSLDINDSEKLDNFIPLNERILSKLEELGMLPRPQNIEAATSQILYCYYPEIIETKNDEGWYEFDAKLSKLWESEDEEE